MKEVRKHPKPADLEQLLRTYGPLWYPAKVGAHRAPTQGHVVVIGIDGSDLFFNDPLPIKSGAAMQQFPIAEFFGAYLIPVQIPFASGWRSQFPSDQVWPLPFGCAGGNLPAG
ncbi:MAG: papain-like cysteine protease family protein [Candidatus Competibacteraceae bacterium]